MIKNIQKLKKALVNPNSKQTGRSMYLCKNEECIKKAAALEEKMLKSVCIWRLNNRGDGASAKLCHDTIKGDF